MIVFPNAKINIGLRITGKRSDGYHDIETIFYPVSLSDVLEFVVSDQKVNRDLLKVTGIETGSTTEENLVLKTISKLREKYSIPFLNIHLHKVIPVGSGLGGGSSDAASILKVINKHFSLNLDGQDLEATALELGSDCPFFIENNPSFASGRGEILTPVGPVLEGYHLVIINPGVSIGTMEAYRNCSPRPAGKSLRELIGKPLTEWKYLIKNDFEDFAFKKLPIIGGIKKGLYQAGAVFSLMSGSGSTVYGIFTEKPVMPEKLRELVIWEGLM